MSSSGGVSFQPEGATADDSKAPEKVDPQPHAPSAPSEKTVAPPVWRPQVDLAKVQRGKVPRFDGRSLMDWSRVRKKKEAENPEFLRKVDIDDNPQDGLRKILPEMNREEVEAHNDVDDLWMVIRGIVYDVTIFQRFHPGGEVILRECAGCDATDLYDFYHKWVACEPILGICAVGVLSRGVQ